MRGMPAEYYGDATRWFVGTVVDNSPPYGLEGRVRVRISGIHSDNVNDVPQADLPWAQVMVPSTSHGVSGLGANSMLSPGALVFGFFLDGHHSQLPLILGSVPHTEYPTSVQAAGRDDPASNLFAYDYVSSLYNGVAPQAVTSPATNTGNARIAATKFFIDNGYSAMHSAAIVGVIEALSQFDPNKIVSDVNKGLMLWGSQDGRLQQLQSFAGTFEPKLLWTDFNVQLLFILNELRSTRSVAHSKLIATNSIEGDVPTTSQFSGNGACAVFAKYYLSAAVKAKSFVADSKSRANNILEIIRYG